VTDSECEQPAVCQGTLPCECQSVCHVLRRCDPNNGTRAPLSRRGSSSAPCSVTTIASLVSLSDSCARGGDAIGDHDVRALDASFAARMPLGRRRSPPANATSMRDAFASSDLGGDVGRRSSAMLSSTLRLRRLSIAGARGPPVGEPRRSSTMISLDSTPASTRPASAWPSRRGTTSAPPTAASCRSRTGDKRDARASAAALRRQGQNHASAGAVGDEAHGVDRLPASSGGDQHLDAGEIGRRECAAHGFDDHRRVGQTSTPDVTRGEVAFPGRDDDAPVAPDLLDATAPRLDAPTSRVCMAGATRIGQRAQSGYVAETTFDASPDASRASVDAVAPTTDVALPPTVRARTVG